MHLHFKGVLSLKNKVSSTKNGNEDECQAVKGIPEVMGSKTRGPGSSSWKEKREIFGA